MFDPMVHATRDEERYAKEGETLFQHLFRVHEHWKLSPDSLVFRTLPAELKRDFPDVYGRIDDEKLGTVVALVWVFLGGKGAVNEAVIRKWFSEAACGNPEPGSGRL